MPCECWLVLKVLQQSKRWHTRVDFSFELSFSKNVQQSSKSHSIFGHKVTFIHSSNLISQGVQVKADLCHTQCKKQIKTLKGAQISHSEILSPTFYSCLCLLLLLLLLLQLRCVIMSDALKCPVDQNVTARLLSSELSGVAVFVFTSGGGANRRRQDCLCSDWSDGCRYNQYVYSLTSHHLKPAPHKVHGSDWLEWV